jgi:hypothetical protein
MLARLSFALLVAANPVLAAAPASKDIVVDGSGQAYKLKKVCHTVEVAGSFIPRTNCITKKIPIRKPDGEDLQAVDSAGAVADQSTKASEEK